MISLAHARLALIALAKLGHSAAQALPLIATADEPQKSPRRSEGHFLLGLEGKGPLLEAESRRPKQAELKPCGCKTPPPAVR
jgi:hypothetical protein